MDLVRVDGRYRLQGKVGSGSFGKVYLTEDIFLQESVVIKLEPLVGKHLTLRHEFHVYKNLCGGIGIPGVRWFGIEAGFSAMVMDRLGQSLGDLFVDCNFRFTLKTVLSLAGQLLRRLQHIHSRNFIHRDLKPSNIVMGTGKQANVVYLIDFGLSKEFRDPDTHLHVRYSRTRGLIGTATFASIHSHLGSELGRRDDLESLAYLLIYFLRGSLPWEGLRNVRDIVRSKRRAKRNLCHGLPVEFRNFVDYCHSLDFDARPDYDRFCRLFGDLQSREGFENDMGFDWNFADDQISNGWALGNIAENPQHGHD